MPDLSTVVEETISLQTGVSSIAMIELFLNWNCLFSRRTCITYPTSLPIIWDGSFCAVVVRLLQQNR